MACGAAGLQFGAAGDRRGGILKILLSDKWNAFLIERAAQAREDGRSRSARERYWATRAILLGRLRSPWARSEADQRLYALLKDRRQEEAQRLADVAAPRPTDARISRDAGEPADRPGPGPGR